MAGLLVHDWIEKIGGSELVLQQMHLTFPDADVLTLWNNNEDLLKPAKVTESWLAHTPLRGKKAVALPLMPLAWRHTLASSSGWDFVLVSSHSFAHQVRTHPSVRKLVYVHSPARYVWVPELDGRGKSAVARAVSRPLRKIDRRRAQEADGLVANSQYISDRISTAWHRESNVIYPPVRVETLQATKRWADHLTGSEQAVLGSLPADFLLGASRFVSYKRLDLVIKTGELLDMPVVIAGRGPELEALKSLGSEASVPVVIVENPSDPLLFALYQECSTFVFPAIEDFGIMPVEAAAVGASVVVNKEGGASESVVHGKTGAVVDFSSPESLKHGVELALGTAREDSQNRARLFGEQRFRDEIATWITDSLGPGRA